MRGIWRLVAASKRVCISTAASVLNSRRTVPKIPDELSRKTQVLSSSLLAFGELLAFGDISAVPIKSKKKKERCQRIWDIVVWKAWLLRVNRKQNVICPHSGGWGGDYSTAFVLTEYSSRRCSGPGTTLQDDLRKTVQGLPKLKRRRDRYTTSASSSTMLRNTIAIGNVTVSSVGLFGREQLSGQRFANTRAKDTARSWTSPLLYNDTRRLLEASCIL